MPKKSLDILVSRLPFEAGEGFVATVYENGVAHITVSLANTQQKVGKLTSGEDGSEFLSKWGGTLTGRNTFQEEIHAHESRMLHYIEKYGLDARALG